MSDLSALSSISGLSGLSERDSYYQYLINNNSTSTMLNALSGDSSDSDSRGLSGISNLLSQGEGDDEQIEVNLADIPSNIDKIAFTVTIYDAEVRRQNFGQVSNAYIRLVNVDTNEEIIRYDLGEDFSIETAVVVGEIYRHNGEWKFNAIGSGFQGGLAALCGHYGIEVA